MDQKSRLDKQHKPSMWCTTSVHTRDISLATCHAVNVQAKPDAHMAIQSMFSNQRLQASDSQEHMPRTITALDLTIESHESELSELEVSESVEFVSGPSGQQNRQ